MNRDKGRHHLSLMYDDLLGATARTWWGKGNIPSVVLFYPAFDVGDRPHWTQLTIWSSGGATLAFAALVSPPGVGMWY